MGAKTIVIIVILAILAVIGVMLCLGKWSFLLGSVRDMEEGKKRIVFTRICGAVLLVLTAALAVVLFV